MVHFMKHINKDESILYLNINNIFVSNNPYLVIGWFTVNRMRLHTVKEREYLFEVLSIFKELYLFRS